MDRSFATFVQQDLTEIILENLRPGHIFGEIRLCIDMRYENTAIKRIRHEMQTMDDIIHKHNSATVFCKLDFNPPMVKPFRFTYMAGGGGGGMVATSTS